jgi:hypothetical protein
LISRLNAVLFFQLPAPACSPTFRDEYVKAYGHTAWDERVKVLDGAVEKTEVYIMKWRKDLRSQ